MTTPVSYPLFEAVSTVLAPASGGAMVQSAWNTAVAGTTVTVTLGSSNPAGPSPGPTTAGNCLIVYVGTLQITTNPTVSGITLGGAAGNFASAISQNNNADCNVEIWADRNCAGGQTVVVVTFNAGTGGNQSNIVYVEEWSGLISTSNPVDKTAGANGNSTAPASGNTATLIQASELAVGCIVAGSTITGPASPWANRSNISAGVIFLIAGNQILSSTSPLGYAGTIASNVWGAVIATLKIAPVTVVQGSGTVRISPGQAASPGSGVGAPRNSGLMWNVTGIGVSVATNVKEASAAAYISYGIQSATANDFQGQTQTGSTGDTCTVNATLRPGDWITVVWSGGDASAIATARIFGTVSPPGVP